MKKNRFEILWLLFTNMLYISAFTFGGGFVIVSLMKKRFVDKYGLLDDGEMADLTAMAQSSPGAIAVNAAILTGRSIAGGAGMFAAVLGTIIPPITIICAISLCYDLVIGNKYVALFMKGMSFAAAAVIADVAVSMAKSCLKGKGVVPAVTAALAFIAYFVFRVNVAYIISAAVALGVMRWFAARGKGGAA